jgi:hypothetical protein
MLSSENSQKDKSGKDESKKSKSPSNIFLINKELNPMFGVPREKGLSKSSNIPGKNLNEAQKKIVKADMKKNIIEEVKEKKSKQKRSVRSTGILRTGFNFVKDTMKDKKGGKSND